ncbi:MOSC domain-containing protein [Metabacillus fastidiosus]|uniref:MOSC domain-containing protein n=1 Tax=Metabacillus fastidiosus TaxID=1458 RepID=A0ABU6P2G1_9BACI|nr:MOSC domain-containing protein [Metabacillus fastidiosus]MED4403549.1 MOSC domain-containing protein [Metabacillus fastidiosus]
MTIPLVSSLWRYPVKSMMGEEMNACYMTEKGLLGDRAFGVIDIETGKLANAKNPLKWPNMFQYRAAFVKPPHVDEPIPPVRITFPNGQMILSTDNDKDVLLTETFNRNVKLSIPSTEDVEFEGYIPEELTEVENPGSIFTRESPKGTFYDIGIVHLITTATIDRLREINPSSRIEARRFRPNIIIDVPNGEGFIENEWVGKTLAIGDEVELKIMQNTKRCIMTTLAQGDLPKDTNVLKSIVKHNEGSFGVYASVIKKGEIKIGDQIKLKYY